MVVFDGYALLTIKSEFATYDPLFPTSSAAILPVALQFLPVALLCAAANQQTHCERRMAAQADIDAMDWGPGTIAVGTQEAEEAITALVSAAVKVDGASAGPANEKRIVQRSTQRAAAQQRSSAAA